MPGADPAWIPERVSRPWGQRSLEAVALASAGLLLGALAARVAGRLDGVASLGVLGAAVTAGYLASDLVSGLAHWFGDRFLEADTRWIGPWLIAPFREHHRDPLAMTRHGSLELLGNSALGTLPILATVWWSVDSLVVEGLVVAFAAAAIVTNRFHAWAHAPRVPPAVAWLQARGLILPPAHHARHHRPGHARAYCVTTGWMNRWTDGLGLFVALERALRALGVPGTRVP